MPLGETTEDRNRRYARERYHERKAEVLEKLRLRRSTKDGHFANLFSQAKSRAKKKKLEFSIEKGEIELVDHCPLLGIPLSWGVVRGEKGGKDDSPSLDRVDSSKGYVAGNVKVVSTLANMIMSKATPAQLKMVASRIDGYMS